MSGDEAMLMAKQLPKASVIVSSNRKEGIELAIQRGAERIILDDGFNRVEIEKFEILLFPNIIKNYLPLPAGGFREFYHSKLFADLNLVEGRDFRRVVTIENPTERMLLVTAISNPKRLDSFLPKGVVGKIYLQDHAYFDETTLKWELNRSGATSLLTTEKDEVKMLGFKLPLSVMRLRVEIEEKILNKIKSFN
jgi:tetraacyldisaccharide 4'-kinase